MSPAFDAMNRAIAGSLVLLMTAPVPAQASPENPAAPPFHVGVPTRPMILKQVRPQLPLDAQVGTYGAGPLCLYRIPITVDHLFEKNPTKSYALAFATEAGIAGYAVAGRSLFGREARIRPEIEVGAAITALSAGGCAHDGSSGRKRGVLAAEMTATVTTTVDWQVFEARRKKLLFRQSTRGHGDGAGGKALTEAARVAFENAAKQLLADPGFLAAVRKAGD